MPIPNPQFKDVMSSIPTSVGIILVSVEDSQIVGCTISSFFSISVNQEEESVGFVLRNNSRTGTALEERNTFRISILGQNQIQIANIFASRKSPEDLNKALKETNKWEANAVCHFELKYIKKYAEKWSTLYISNLISFQMNSNIKPLIYSHRKFSSISSPR